MLGIAPDVQIIDLAHDIPAHDVRAGALLLVRAIQYLPEGCIVVAVVDPGVGTDRRLLGVEVEGGVLARPRQRPARTGGGDGRRRHPRGRAHESRLPAAGAGADLRRPRHPRARGGQPRRRRRPRRPRARSRPRGPRARPRVAPRAARGRRDRGGSVVGRPVRELPAQRRPRCARSRGHRARRPGRGAPAHRGAGRAVGAHVRRSETVRVGGARRLLRPAVARARPGVGGRRARPQSRQRRDARRRRRQPLAHDRSPKQP